MSAEILDDTPALQLTSVDRVFGEGAAEVHAVNDVNLTVNEGEIVLIMGPSGSGKTTLLTMIAGLLRPSSGSIEVFGRDLSNLPESQRAEMRRQHIGFVFQSFNLLSSLTAIQNVEIALNLAGVRGREAAAQATEMLTKVGLGGRLHFRPDKLSGGERQRVSIARALVNNAPIILADEPTANLDSRNGREVVSLLSELARGGGKSVVIVSHDPRIREAADRVLWLEDGRLRVEDPVVEAPVVEDVPLFETPTPEPTPKAPPRRRRRNSGPPAPGS